MISAPEEFVRNHAYVRYVRQLCELHELMKAGRGDSVDADDLRDEMDESWRRLNAEQITRADEISADLYSLESESPIQHPIAVRDGDSDARQELKERLQQRQWRAALRILRLQPGCFDGATAAPLRGLCWERLGEAGIAARFYEEAARLSPDVPIRLIDAERLRGNTSIALRLARLMSQRIEQLDAEKRIQQALTVMALALESNGVADRRWGFEWAGRTLADAVKGAESASSFARFSELNGVAAFCLWMAELQHEALEKATLSIQREPLRADTRILRGWIQYKTNEELALAGFRFAVEHGCTVFLPYRLLLAHALQVNDLPEARRLVAMAQAVQRTPEEEADFRLICESLVTLAASGQNVVGFAVSLPSYGDEAICRLALDLAA